MDKGILLTAEPFKKIANTVGITPQEVITRLTKLRENGVIRRFGASIKPNALGFSANALVAWNVPENRVQEVGTCLSKFKEITHCYERKPIAGKWEYNLYTVMHARERKAIEGMVTNFSEAISISDYIILYSAKNLKKTSVNCTSTATFPTEASVKSHRSLKGE